MRVMRAREHRSESQSMQRLLRPRHVAVIGASRAYRTVGRTLLQNLHAYNFTGEIYVVNPGADEVDGRHAYNSVEEIEEPVDIAIIAVPVVVRTCR